MMSATRINEFQKHSPQDTTTKPRRLIRLNPVLQRTGIGRSTLYDYMSRGLFPKSIKLGRRSVAWSEESIDAWIEQRIAASQGEGQG